MASPRTPLVAPVTPRIDDREGLLSWYRRNRARTGRLFDLVAPSAYYRRPIPLRHPIVFYEGHISAFSFNTLVKRALGRPPIDERLETLFARGIDPADKTEARRSERGSWPERAEVQGAVARWDAAVEEALATENLDRPGHPLLDRGEAAYTALEHELLHQETLLYMLHRLPHGEKRRPPGAGLGGGEAAPAGAASPPAPATVRVPAGRATLGAERGEIAFGWDNEFPRLELEVPEFEIDLHDVTNLDYLEFVLDGGYEDPDFWSDDGWAWRSREDVRHPRFWERHGDEWEWCGMFENLPLPPAGPVYVSYDEALAYARWSGARLPTEEEFHRAAYGAPDGRERPQPWGDEPPDPRFGNFDFARWDPAPVGTHPAGASAWGVHDLVGNGWEWTATPFAGFPGFRPMASYPEYSADFFDGLHYVLKGASPATPRELVRRSFRNWFRADYPYVYAAFRLVRS